MRISDILKRAAPAISFEFFPPKDDEGFSHLFETIAALQPLQPSYVSVTYGAGGSTRRKTVDLVKRIKSEIGIEAMAHLTCVGATAEETAAVLDQLQDGGIENVLALRGDPPKGQETFVKTEGGFAYASELAAFISTRYSFCLGGACYPETHPESPDPRTDIENLVRKVEAGVEFLITQLFFDNEDFLRFRDTVAARGIQAPVLAGIMPILSVKQIKRFTKMCGASIPASLLTRIEAVEDDPEAVRQLGMYHAAQQCDDLLREGVAGLHFYTLNRSTATRAIYQQIRSRLAASSDPRSTAPQKALF